MFVHKAFFIWRLSSSGSKNKQMLSAGCSLWKALWHWDVDIDIRFKPDAVMALQAASEEYLVEVFSKAAEVADQNEGRLLLPISTFFLYAQLESE